LILAADWHHRELQHSGQILHVLRAVSVTLRHLAELQRLPAHAVVVEPYGVRPD
jgi:hypothetical protein